MGKKSLYLGATGQGARMKLVRAATAALVHAVRPGDCGHAHVPTCTCMHLLFLACGACARCQCWRLFGMPACTYMYVYVPAVAAIDLHAAQLLEGAVDVAVWFDSSMKCRLLASQ